MRKNIHFIFFLCLLLLIGCNQENNSNRSDWFEKKEEAIEHGLHQEGTDSKAVLSIQEIDGETIVFYLYESALGVASITESDKGCSWYRSRAYTDFEGDVPYSTAGFEYETATGLSIPILVGKAFDISIEKMKLVENGTERELQIFENSRLFFAIHTLPFSSIEVIPIKK